MTPGKNQDGHTPLMRQFFAIKEKHPDKILFFRMGDFYEMFGDDAVKAAPILQVALTSRSHGGSERIPLAGVPYHAADRYLARLLKAGEKVVVVEQVEDPKTAKGLVKRDIVEILTPGTATLDEDENRPPSWLTAICRDHNGKKMGLAALDLSTGSFRVEEGPGNAIAERVRMLDPAETIYPSEVPLDDLMGDVSLPNGNTQWTSFGDWNFDYKMASRELNAHFATSTLDGFGVAGQRLAIAAAGAVLRYLKDNHRDQLNHVTRLTPFDNDRHMVLDFATARNLELVRSFASGDISGSLLGVMDRCHTAAGSRRLRESLLRPFRDRDAIEHRLSGVTELVRSRDLCFALREKTRGLVDLERLAGRLGIGRLNPRQAANIAQALETAAAIKQTLENATSPLLSEIARAMPETSRIVTRLRAALTDEPPLSATKGDVIRRGYSATLDELNDSIRDARAYIASLQKEERERTGISSLKVGYNKVFGYYIEVTRVHADKVPSEYIRKQTLVNAERYITPELKEREELIQSAEEKIFSLEAELFADLVSFLNDNMNSLLATASLLAETDLVSALADLAVEHGYCLPSLHEDTRLNICGGRHPVIETVLPSGSFVTNDCALASDSRRIVILTGPNMSGKSTYLRQLGLIVIMAQIGSYVPADTAEIGIADRIFTRVGASDNLAGGQSTFLVEMVETANILHNATERSLVLLDEVGRGTSTFDGLSVAWAVVENINEHNRSRTVFATHYHELTSMSELYEHVSNYQVAVKRWEDQVVFMHQIVPGGCDDSYGVEVARLAGLPRSAVSRARQILKLLESGKFTQSELGKGLYVQKVQPTLFDPAPSETERRIAELDLDSMTPLEALNLLKKLKEDLS